MKKGQKVKMVTGQMGLMSSQDETRFVSETLNYGDEATFEGDHLNPELATKGWVLLRVERDGRTLWCPAHDSHFEAVVRKGQPSMRGLSSLLP